MLNPRILVLGSLNANLVTRTPTVPRGGETLGEDRILFIAGANAIVGSKLFSDFIAKVKPDVMVLQLETPLETVFSVIKLAKQHKIEVLLNPAPAVELPEKAFNGLDYLVMNETKAVILAGPLATS
ncbi:MAG: hypothetical protein Q9187_000531 [Circinaria calcarea]